MKNVLILQHHFAMMDLETFPERLEQISELTTLHLTVLKIRLIIIFGINTAVNTLNGYFYTFYGKPKLLQFNAYMDFYTSSFS